jgi:hypothetical protein
VGYFDSDEINYVCRSFDALVPLWRDSLTQDERGLFTLSKWRSFFAPRIEGRYHAK